MTDNKILEQKAKELRLKVLESIYRSKKGHIGGIIAGAVAGSAAVWGLSHGSGFGGGGFGGGGFGGGMSGGGGAGR